MCQSLLKYEAGCRRPRAIQERSCTQSPAQGSTEPFAMSHALLLRLFLSPSFFSVHVALQYLCFYADNIGITYYLTRRLRELETRELRDVWCFVWCVFVAFKTSGIEYLSLN